MRGFGKKLPSTSILVPPSSSSALPYSTFGGGGGGGRGRGRGFIPSPSPSDSQDQETSPLPSAGHGRGVPSASASPGDGGGPFQPIFPSFPAFSSPSISCGRGGRPDPTPTKQPIFFNREKSPFQFSSPDDDKSLESGSHPLPHPLPTQPTPVLAGFGRGKSPSVPAPKLHEIIHHARPHQPLGGPAAPLGPTAPVGQKLNREDAIKRAVDVLSRGGSGGGRGGGRGRGVGMRGRGRGGWRGRRDADDELELYVGDNADGEWFVKKMGVERMKLVETAFEEASYNVLPSRVEDAYLDALHTNNMIEYEPEYLMEFDRNPDIDENPPMSLEEVLQRAKPFLVSYEGIKSQEEWEEIIKDLMERLPHMKELIDRYCGPDRVTAKQQMQELERVANTLPDNIPSSVKRFTNHVVLSLQSNPGWGWAKKCQFMDTLVWEATQPYQ